jgi:signal transduction histidine kinase
MPSAEKDIIIAVFTASVALLVLSTLIVLLVYNYFRVKNRRNKEILRAVFEAQESERNRIAEDLHDHIGGKMSALKLHNEIMLADSPSPTTDDYCRKSGVLIDNIVTDIRKIVRNQASKYILQNGLGHELRNLCGQYKENPGIEIDLDLDQAAMQINPDFKVALFRIIQELLHNTVKHAQATQVMLRMLRNGNTLEVCYSDNGKGFEAGTDHESGMGLQNIRTRIKLYNGSIKFESIPFKQTTYTFTFNIRDVS